MIQIDEPALREGLPLRRSRTGPAISAGPWPCFRLATASVRDETQIHMHWCYSEFNEIIEAISDLDADVISIENSRSDAGSCSRSSASSAKRQGYWPRRL